MRLCYCFILLVAASVARGEWKVAPEAMVTRWGKQATPQNVWQEEGRHVLMMVGGCHCSTNGVDD